MANPAQAEKERLDSQWLEYPVNKPYTGWCVTTDGGDIALEFWTGKRWVNENRDIIEFMQVTVNPYS